MPIYGVNCAQVNIFIKNPDFVIFDFREFRPAHFAMPVIQS